MPRPFIVNTVGMGKSAELRFAPMFRCRFTPQLPACELVLRLDHDGSSRFFGSASYTACVHRVRGF
jgi:hypothetical protein